MTDKFEKEFENLIKKKKLTSLYEDLEVAKKATIELFHIENYKVEAICLVPNYCNETVKICKLRKFSCRALKGKGAQTGIRIIYAFWEKNGDKYVEFIEIYQKSNKENMDYDRAKEYIKHF